MIYFYLFFKRKTSNKGKFIFYYFFVIPTDETSNKIYSWWIIVCLVVWFVALMEWPFILASQFLGKLCRSSLPIVSVHVHSLVINWHLLFLNQGKRKNGKSAQHSLIVLNAHFFARHVSLFIIETLVNFKTVAAYATCISVNILYTYLSNRYFENVFSQNK